MAILAGELFSQNWSDFHMVWDYCKAYHSQQFHQVWGYQLKNSTFQLWGNVASFKAPVTVKFTCFSGLTHLELKKHGQMRYQNVRCDVPEMIKSQKTVLRHLWRHNVRKTNISIKSMFFNFQISPRNSSLRISDFMQKIDRLGAHMSYDDLWNFDFFICTELWPIKT